MTIGYLLPGLWQEQRQGTAGNVPISQQLIGRKIGERRVASGLATKE